MKKSNLNFAFAFLAIFLNACNDEQNDIKEPSGDYENGYFITNEGPFQNGSGTITFVDDNGIASQNVYKTVNNEDLGNIVNSMYVFDDKAYIVVNNSNKVVVVNKNTMKKEAVIEGDDILNPRFFVASQGKGYISNWGDPFNAEDDFITVINLESNDILKKIPVGEGPEKMVIKASKLFVCLQGGFGSNHIITVIDTADDTVTSNLTVGDVPNSIVVDNSGDLWVLCGGNPAFTGNETPGFLYKINTADNALSFLEFESNEHPSLLNMDAGYLYYTLDGKVYQVETQDAELPSDALVGIEGYFYAMHVQNGELYTTDAGDYASEGKLKIFNIVSGDLLQTITTGIVPGQVVFP